jgi:hypothetical protein
MLKGFLRGVAVRKLYLLICVFLIALAPMRLHAEDNQDPKHAGGSGNPEDTGGSQRRRAPTDDGAAPISLDDIKALESKVGAVTGGVTGIASVRDTGEVAAPPAPY